MPVALSAAAAFDATERRQAARSLLATPLLTNVAHPEQLKLVRRHAAALKQTFQSVLGYPLVVESGFARLLKPALTDDTETRPVHRTSGQDFSPRAYTYLALVCAALLAESTGEQVLISSLVEQVRADAVTAGLTIDDSYTETGHLVQAVMLLIGWGVLSETEGTVVGWGSRKDEALLDVHRPVLPHLLSGPLLDLRDPEAAMAAGGRGNAGPDQPRRSLRRKLVENPLVRREDLTDAERDVLSRERRELGRVLEDAFGLTLEVRLEGALAYDTDGELTDLAFPASGTVRHVALLLLNALIDDLKVPSDSTVALAGRSVPGALAPWDLVKDNVALLIERYGATFGATYTADPDGLQRDVVRLLDGLSLTRSTADGLMMHPACARYRPDPEVRPASTRAARRLADSPPLAPNRQDTFTMPDLIPDQTKTR